MTKGFFNISKPQNEPVQQYLPGSEERKELNRVIEQMKSEIIEIPMYIGGDLVKTDTKVPISPPHDHQHIIGYYHKGNQTHIEEAVNAALAAKEIWERMSWEHRASIFLKAADLISGPYRAKINAATMLGQSKNVFQAEIDSACELIDFLRFNVYYMTQIYAQQPDSAKNIWNRIEQRPLEGFVFALTPFNFTSIAGNLPTAPAIMGNVVVWKPSRTQIFSAGILTEIFLEAGLPPGVINMVLTDGPSTAEVILKHPYFSGIHFTGSTSVFHSIWETIGKNISNYISYPRIVGETGGKDFILVHETANVREVSTAIIRGAFEYQGQKCSAASRAYIPDSKWQEIKALLMEDIEKIKMGDPSDFTCFMNAVIDEKSFDKISSYIDEARKSPLTEIIAGGNFDKSKGYFIEPTIIVTQDPQYTTMVDELFGPVLTVYVYDSGRFDDVLYLVDNTSSYALTGALFAKDRAIIEHATEKLRNAAGNFYINDKPTGAVVGQQPFGGARASGTNDKAGSMINLLRWVSPRTIKENFVPPTDFQYPFMKEE